MANLKVKLVKGLAGKKKGPDCHCCFPRPEKTGDVSVQPTTKRPEAKSSKFLTS